MQLMHYTFLRQYNDNQTTMVHDATRLALLGLIKLEQQNGKLRVAWTEAGATSFAPSNEPITPGVRRPAVTNGTCAEQNKHMKSRRSVKVKGRDCRVRLDSKKVKQLLQYPGKWRCILRLGKTEVGEASARVG